ncbi:exopolysaccharide Pel transporter PelG [Exiguobacterium aestuarii]|uniref:exopolysaccharide Pel transporter PelG n=1 Tax=Exiguobacterium aestuarii TaxID=273527 RepID=UPI001CD5AC6F|nr:exopolysaccharide Pel transporter PelG [Exiguobacterium aestuarii]MCA0981174.1 exopolysaccharide Pel transporter PelG [Exiguobacterium aestuarii]
MAGIGFQLKRLYDKSGFFGQLRAYGYSAITAVGPMFLSILLITASREWLLYLNVGASEVNIYMAAVQYTFIFSQLLTGGFLFTISRFVADQTFLEKEENVLSSLYGLISLIVMIGLVISVLFYMRSPLPFSYKLVTYLYFTQLSVIWILSMYVSALKDYKKIVTSYVLGTLVAAFFIWLLTSPLGHQTATSVFIGLNLGFFVILIRLFRDIHHYFQVNNRNYFYFLVYLEKYPLLFLIGTAYYFGLYGHNLATWFSDRAIIVGETYLMAPYYDTPVFYAYLSVLPSLVLFMVTLETTFYTSYKKYYGRILNGYPFQDIQTAKREMFRVLGSELLFMAQVQMLVTFIFLFLGVRLLPFLGMTQNQIDIFIIVVLGSWFLSLVITIFLILLYFDERRAAIQLTGFYAVTSFLVTLALVLLFDVYGIGMFLSAILAFMWGTRLLIRSLNDIDYTTFCSQPIVYQEVTTKTELFLRRIGSLS